jgi:predicted CXXCH cytochrome family protein
MKKIVLLTAALIMTASMAYAGSSLISGTKHNLSSGSGNVVKSGAGDQICIFCHTPHNAVRNVPLWNRTNPAAATYKMYTASATLNFNKVQAGFTADSISLFCLSCHDGNSAIGGNVVRNSSGQILTMANSANVNGDKLVIGNTANLGSDLTSSHPVAFDYTQSAAGDTGIQPINATRVDQSGTAKFPLFKAGAKSYQLECATCHKVHNDTNTPFLRTTQTGSALCYACHIK